MHTFSAWVFGFGQPQACTGLWEISYANNQTLSGHLTLIRSPWYTQWGLTEIDNIFNQAGPLLMKAQYVANSSSVATKDLS